MSAMSTGLRRPGITLLLALLLACQATYSAPVYEQDTTQVAEYDGATAGCFYNYQHYQEGDRIITNEPCLNCTCHNRMLMCYLRVCPFTKAIGQDCTVEKRPDQCCPVITCPEVPVQLLTSTTSAPASPGSTDVGFHDNYGCVVHERFYADGAQLPINPQNPCELCYCIRNRTTCVMQECTLNVAGCKPVYQPGICCPVKYNCEYDEEPTTIGTTPGLIMTTTMAPGLAAQCYHEGKFYEDGDSINSTQACQHCYCFRGDIACAVQDCGTPMQMHGKNCTAVPPPEGECCPTTYECEGDILETMTTIPKIGEESPEEKEQPTESTSVTQDEEEHQRPTISEESYPGADNAIPIDHGVSSPTTTVEYEPVTEKSSAIPTEETNIPSEENVSGTTTLEEKQTSIPEEQTQSSVTPETATEASKESTEGESEVSAGSTEESISTEKDESVTKSSSEITPEQEIISTEAAITLSGEKTKPSEEPSTVGLTEEAHETTEVTETEKEVTPTSAGSSTESETPLETSTEIKLPSEGEDNLSTTEAATHHDETSTQVDVSQEEEKVTTAGTLPTETEKSTVGSGVTEEVSAQTELPTVTETTEAGIVQSTESHISESSSTEIEVEKETKPALTEVSSTEPTATEEKEIPSIGIDESSPQPETSAVPTESEIKPEMSTTDHHAIDEEAVTTEGPKFETTSEIHKQESTSIPISERLPEQKSEDEEAIDEMQVTQGYIDHEGSGHHLPDNLMTEAPSSVSTDIHPADSDVTSTEETEMKQPKGEVATHDYSSVPPSSLESEVTTQLVDISTSEMPISTTEKINEVSLTTESTTVVSSHEEQSTESIEHELPTKGLGIEESSETSSEEISSEVSTENETVTPKNEESSEETTEKEVSSEEVSTESSQPIDTSSEVAQTEETEHKTELPESIDTTPFNQLEEQSTQSNEITPEKSDTENEVTVSKEITTQSSTEMDSSTEIITEANIEQSTTEIEKSDEAHEQISGEPATEPPLTTGETHEENIPSEGVIPESTTEHEQETSSAQSQPEVTENVTEQSVQPTVVDIKPTEKPDEEVPESTENLIHPEEPIEGEEKPEQTTEIPSDEQEQTEQSVTELHSTTRSSTESAESTVTEASSTQVTQEEEIVVTKPTLEAEKPEDVSIIEEKSTTTPPSFEETTSVVDKSEKVTETSTLGQMPTETVSSTQEDIEKSTESTESVEGVSSEQPSQPEEHSTEVSSIQTEATTIKESSEAPIPENTPQIETESSTATTDIVTEEILKEGEVSTEPEPSKVFEEGVKGKPAKPTTEQTSTKEITTSTENQPTENEIPVKETTETNIVDAIPPAVTVKTPISEEKETQEPVVEEEHTTTGVVSQEVPVETASEEPQEPTEHSEQAETKPDLETSTAVVDRESSGIPGEGNCLVDGQSYNNNSEIPSANPCQMSCHCISSIVQCKLVDCPPPPSNIENCMPIPAGKDTCCPRYSCSFTPESKPEPEADNHVVEQDNITTSMPDISTEESTEKSLETDTEQQTIIAPAQPEEQSTIVTTSEGEVLSHQTSPLPTETIHEESSTSQEFTTEKSTEVAVPKEESSSPVTIEESSPENTSAVPQKEEEEQQQVTTVKQHTTELLSSTEEITKEQSTSSSSPKEEQTTISDQNVEVESSTAAIPTMEVEKEPSTEIVTGEQTEQTPQREGETEPTVTSEKTPEHEMSSTESTGSTSHIPERQQPSEVPAEESTSSSTEITDVNVTEENQETQKPEETSSTEPSIKTNDQTTPILEINTQSEEANTEITTMHDHSLESGPNESPATSEKTDTMVSTEETIVVTEETSSPTIPVEIETTDIMNTEGVDHSTQENPQTEEHIPTEHITEPVQTEIMKDITEMPEAQTTLEVHSSSEVTAQPEIEISKPEQTEQQETSTIAEEKTTESSTEIAQESSSPSIENNQPVITEESQTHEFDHTEEQTSKHSVEPSEIQPQVTEEPVNVIVKESTESTQSNEITHVTEAEIVTSQEPEKENVDEHTPEITLYSTEQSTESSLYADKESTESITSGSTESDTEEQKPEEEEIVTGSNLPEHSTTSDDESTQNSVEVTKEYTEEQTQVPVNIETERPTEKEAVPTEGIATKDNTSKPTEEIPTVTEEPTKTFNEGETTAAYPVTSEHVTDTISSTGIPIEESSVSTETTTSPTKIETTVSLEEDTEHKVISTTEIPDTSKEQPTESFITEKIEEEISSKPEEVSIIPTSEETSELPEVKPTEAETVETEPSQQTPTEPSETTDLASETPVEVIPKISEDADATVSSTESSEEENIHSTTFESPIEEDSHVPKTPESTTTEEKQVTEKEIPVPESSEPSVVSEEESTPTESAPTVEGSSPTEEERVTISTPAESSTLAEEEHVTVKLKPTEQPSEEHTISSETSEAVPLDDHTDKIEEHDGTESVLIGSSESESTSQSITEEAVRTSTPTELVVPEEVSPTTKGTVDETVATSSILPEEHEKPISTSEATFEIPSTDRTTEEQPQSSESPILEPVEPSEEVTDETKEDEHKPDDTATQESSTEAEKHDDVEGQLTIGSDDQHLQPVNHTIDTSEPTKPDFEEPIPPQSGTEQYPDQAVGGEDNQHFPVGGGSYLSPDEDYDEDDQVVYGPGTCRYGGKVYVSAQQIPRDDPCDFCFCFRSDIICLQQSCPPPIPGCHEEPISGFCCPRYECHVSMAATLNITTTTTTTTTTLPPHFLTHAYKGAARRSGCQIRGQAYRVGEVIKSASGPCLHCTCGGDGNMKCDPRVCSPEPMLRQMIAAATAKKRR